MSRSELIAAGVLLSLIASGLLLEAIDADVQSFAASHPILVSIASSTLMLALALSVVDVVLRRREASRWRSVAGTAFRELSTDAFKVVSELMAFSEEARNELRPQPRETSVRTLASGLPDEIVQGIDAALEDPDWRKQLSSRTYDWTEGLGRSIARWAPVLLKDPDRAPALDDFSSLRDALISSNDALWSASNKALDFDWREGYWFALDGFCVLFARFDSLRRVALGEPIFFSESGSEHYRRVWGIDDDSGAASKGSGPARESRKADSLR